MQNVVHEAMRNSGLTRRELARRAGVSASTVTRIERGQLDPTLGTASRILQAAGLQFPASVEPLCDPGAVHAARKVLDETSAHGGPNAQNDSPWAQTLMRWASPDGTPNPRRLAAEAGRSSPVRLRPGAVRFRTSWSLLRVFSAVAAVRNGWAVSGAPAASFLGADEMTEPSMIYVEQPGLVASVIEHDEAGGAEIILLPFDGSSESGAWHRDGIVWADPLQIILDCYGMDETAAQADQLAADWTGGDR